MRGAAARGEPRRHGHRHAASAAPRQYIFRVVEHLREITGLGLARAENLVEATQNAVHIAFFGRRNVGKSRSSTR